MPKRRSKNSLRIKIVISALVNTKIAIWTMNLTRQNMQPISLEKKIKLIMVSMLKLIYQNAYFKS